MLFSPISTSISIPLELLPKFEVLETLQVHVLLVGETFKLTCLACHRQWRIEACLPVIHAYAPNYVYCGRTVSTTKGDVFPIRQVCSDPV